MDARVDLWRIDVERCDRLLTDAVLSASEVERAARFRFARDAHAYRVVRSAVRHVLSRYTGIAAQFLKIEDSAFGKPVLASTGAPHFNVSHAGSVGLLAISLEHPVGVDIERMELLDPAEMRRIAALVFCSGEGGELAACQSEDLRARFYDAWVRKEARLKAEGSGFRSRPPGADLPWHTRALDVFPHCAAAVCAQVARFDVTVRDAEHAIGLNVPTRVA